MTTETVATPTGVDSELHAYHLLGRTGLRVSPLALGTMTFGMSGTGPQTAWGSWGADEEDSRAIFRGYLDAGGNFIDTAVNYAAGRSEELLGRFIEEAGARDRVVLATKYTMSATPGDPNAGGNGRKNLISSLERSLRRLRTDYVDLYWLHCWDQMTPVEEVLSTLDALVRSGKVRAIGLSNVPAWYAATAQLTARANGWEPIAALQLQYSLVQRSIEAEFVPAVSELGMAIVGYSPLANGFLTGKYIRDSQGVIGSGRIAEFRGSGHAPTHSDRDWRILDELKAIAAEVGSTPARVAVAWVARRPAVGSTLIGARTPDQLNESLGALELRLTGDQLQRLDRVSAPEFGYPYDFFNGELRNAVMYGGQSRVQREPSWFRSA